ncbi:zinc-ribbon domain-containing protein [Natronobacterium texcoconense]|uniref:Zinc-ribbon domain-containing protein n=1 Tax=Natronobacterium texcoconense TaxID=1095778 RepID=A0A1H1IWE0_NATTX|nr:zinc-ribbon domain-containing protein [Natronobacterium texcoconense]SDR42025.1 zinc-ribbon domain-containing protein [Natronobacterium texcoconense]
MKWRCTWCGKPHEENDPPCDNCGHNKFEEAIVRESDDTAASRTVDTGTTYVWKCPNCGREHVKNNPPCSRCGNPDLEKTEQTYDDVDQELDTPGWLEVAKPYLPVFAVVGIVFLLFATGIIPASILPGIGTPTPPDAPGNGSAVAGIDLEDTEEVVHERLEAERDDPRSLDAGLAAFAEYQNRALIAIEYDDADPDGVPLSEFDVDCTAEPEAGQVAVPDAGEQYTDEAALGDAVAERLLASDVGDEIIGGSATIEGVDLHQVDGTVYVVYATC